MVDTSAPDADKRYQATCLDCGRAGPREPLETRARVGWNGQAAQIGAAQTPREGDRWDCGNGHLRASAALRLIVRNHVSDVRAMEWIDGAIDEAGPAFAQEMSAVLHFDDVPF